MSQTARIDDNQAIMGLPEPHTCPWIVQYALISPLRRLLEPPAKLVGPYVEPGMTVVEPGCGFGYVTLPMARMVGPEGKVVSVDIEPRAVDRMLKRARKAGLAERIDARPCQPHNLGLGEYEGQVDLIPVVHTFHEFADQSGFLAQVARLLKPTGRLLIIEPIGHVRPAQFEAEMELCRRSGFRVVDEPQVGWRRATALLAPPAV